MLVQAAHPIVDKDLYDKVAEGSTPFGHLRYRQKPVTGPDG